VEPHADACPGLAPPPGTVAGTASGSSAVSGPGGPCQPARLVAEPVTGRGDGRDPYDRQTVRLHVDPSRTRWIAWNDQPAVVATSPSRPGQHLLGPGGFGVDDFIELTVTAPDGRSRTARLDANDAFGVSSGPQNVIFGRAGAAPAVLRRSPAGQERIFEEGGALTDLFALPGSYAFTFAFRDETRGRGPYAHGRIWLLVDAVECPVPRGAGAVAQVPSSGVAPPPGSPQALGLPVRLYLWESIHSNQPAYEHGGRYWFYSQEQWTGFLVQRGRDFERYQVQDPGRAMRRYTYQGTERRHDGKDEWHGLWQDLPAGASDRFRIVWP
jgi:hypothetical protein